MQPFLAPRTFAILLFIIVWGALLPSRVHSDPTLTFVNDAAQYNSVAIHLLQDGMYSLDGTTPYFAREPAYSIFLAGIYGLFGIENQIAVFAVQGLILLLAALFFASELRRITSERVAVLFLILTFVCPPIYHVVFSAIREVLALSFALCFAGFVLRMFQKPSWKDAIGAGVCLGSMVLSYAVFLLLPVLLIPLLLFLRFDWKYLALTLITAACVIAPWGIRNTLHTGSPCLTGCNRSAVQWYARGVQVRDLRGLEPLKCLWSEYVSRDWTGRSDACSFNAIMHRRWPEGFTATSEDIAAGEEGKRMILYDPLNYAWVALTDVIELHLPYVNGWGRTYNLLAALSMMIIYIGLPFSLTQWRSRWIWILGCVMVYHTAVFSLTDATPRYLLPIIFCYITLAAVGYDRLLSRIHVWHK